MKRSLAVLGGATVIALLAAGLFALAPDPAKVRSEVSDAQATPEARVERLSHYLKLHSAVRDCAFDAFLSDQGGLGPSEWAIHAAMRIDPADVNAWTAEASPSTAVPDAKLRALVPAGWAVAGEPSAFVRGPTKIFIWRAVGIVLVTTSTF